MTKRTTNDMPGHPPDPGAEDPILHDAEAMKAIELLRARGYSPADVERAMRVLASR
jgi:hypothetical protein